MHTPRRIPASLIHGQTNVPADDVTAAGPIPSEVLVVEDNLIIALDTEDMLCKIGVKTVRLASGVEEALKLIEQHPPDFTLLDVSLGGETSFALAATLAAQGSLFAFSSAYGEPVAFPDNFSHVPRLRKPYSLNSLRSLLVSLRESLIPKSGNRFSEKDHAQVKR